MKPESIEALGGIPVERKPLDFGEIVVRAVHSEVERYRRPEEQAFLAGVILTAAFLSKNYGVFTGGLIAYVGGLAAKRAYLAAADLRTLAAAAHSEYSQPGPG